MRPTQKSLDLKQTTVHYWEYGEDHRPTLVLVHGITGSHEGFQYLVPLLSEFRLIIPDLPGFGISPLPHDNLTLAELGSLLAQFVAGLGLRAKPYIVGHSMGSLVVAEALAQHPGIAQKKLILISPVPTPIGRFDRRQGGAIATNSYYALSRRIPRLSTSKLVTRLSTRAMITTDNPERRREIYQHHYGNLNYISSIVWYSKLYKEVNSKGMSDYADTLAQFDVLILSGDRDIVTPLKHQKQAAKQLGVRLEIIPGVGHLAHYERPGELVRSIKTFLAIAA